MYAQKRHLWRDVIYAGAAVGWVEARSAETHQQSGESADGFRVPLNPSYETSSMGSDVIYESQPAPNAKSCIGFLARGDVIYGWKRHLCEGTTSMESSRRVRSKSGAVFAALSSMRKNVIYGEKRHLCGSGRRMG